MQRGARFVLHRSAPMQRGTHFWILDVPFRALCWAQAEHPRRCKITAVLLILKMKGVPEAATKWIQKSNNCKIYKENLCFSRMPRGALWRPLRVVIFLYPHPEASTWPR